MVDCNENGRFNSSINGSTRYWITSGQYSSPFYDNNNNRGSANVKRNLIRRRLSFNNSDVTNDFNHQESTVNDNDIMSVMTQSKFMTEDVSRWSNDKINNSEDMDIKSKFDEAFSEGSSTSSGDKENDNGTEVELRLRVRRFDEENALLRDELVRAEEVVNGHQRQFRLLQEKLDHMKHKCEDLLKENDEQRETILMIEAQEKRCQVALQRIDKERNSLIEELQTNKEAYNQSLEQLSKDKVHCTKQLKVCKSKLEEKEIECENLQRKIVEMNELISTLEEHYEKTIRFLQDKSDVLTSANSELTMRLMNHEKSSSLDHELCNAPPIYLDSSAESISAQNIPKVELQDSLYSELQASGFSVESVKNDTKIAQLEQELDWYNNEIFEAGRQIYKVINVLKRRKNLGSSFRGDSPDDDVSNEDSSSPIFMIFDRITELSSEVSEALRKPSTCDSSSQVSADAIKPSELLRKFGIKTFNDCLSSPIKVPEAVKTTKSDDVFLTLAEESNKNAKSCHNKSQNTIDIKNNVIIQALSSSYSQENSLEFVELAEDKSSSSSSSSSVVNNKIIKNQSATEINLRIRPTSESTGIDTNAPELLEVVAVEKLPFSSSSPINCNEVELEMSTSQREPRRKISVFSRSFDIDTVYEVQDGGGISESHTLSEHNKINNIVNNDIENSNNDNNILINNNGSYRDTDICGLSDSSASPSPIKLNTWQEEDTPLDNNNKKRQNLVVPIVLAPARLNFSIAKDSMEEKLTNGELTCTPMENKVSSDTTTIIPPPSSSSSPPPTAEQPVRRAMSSGEDSLDDSDTDSPGPADENFHNHHRNELNNNNQLSNTYFENNYTLNNSYRLIKDNNVKNEERTPKIKRSMSEGENLEFGGVDGCRSCTINQSDEKKLNNVKKEVEITAFPSLTDARLQESGIAHLSDSDDLEGKELSEEDLERKYLAFSLGLCTDRVTLSRRRALSIRQRDQIEHNLANEISKMQHSIQEFVPMCFDSETIERIELASNQVEIIAQCARKVAGTAETLGAVQQEYRISRAIFLADRYLKILRNRCEKLAADVAEKKKILAENNIVLDEDTGEGELSSALRYRALSPTANRMMARRRASIATIFRPIGGVQEGAKDNIRQRNSVSGRVTIRRPSFSSESQRWETDKLNRTDSSSVGELREVFEQAGSRRTSREENNNLVRSQVVVCENETIERRMSSGNREEPIIETLPEEQEHELHEDELTSTFAGTRLSFSDTSVHINNWRLMLWCTLISFIIGFYVKDTISSTSACAAVPEFRWSFEEILNRLIHVRNLEPRPI